MRESLYKSILLTTILVSSITFANCQVKEEKASKLDFTKIKSQEILKTFERAKVNNKPVILIFEAVWCPVCKALESETLQNKKVLKTLQNYERLDVDVDENEDDATTLRSKPRSYGGDGIPAIIIFTPDGEELERIIGFTEAPEFNDILKNNLKKTK